MTPPKRFAPPPEGASPVARQSQFHGDRLIKQRAAAVTEAACPEKNE
jgi:hypothetical protein